MNPDARISTALAEHPKTKKLRRRAGGDGCWALICLFLWTARNRATGDLRGMSDEDLELAAGWDGEEGRLVAALAEVGFIDGEPMKRKIHDWAEHNPWAYGSKARSEAAKSAANSRWAKEKDAGGMRGACDSHPEGNAPSPSPSPSPSPKTSQADACPHDDIVSLYHELLPANPHIKSWTGSRRTNLRTRWREDEKRQSLDYWRRFFAHVAASPFLTGRVTGKDERAFLPGLDWLVKPDNFAKVIENRYHDRSAQ